MQVNHRINKIIIARIIITLSMILLMSSGFSISSSLSIYLLYLSPIMIILLAIQVYMDVTCNDNSDCIIVTLLLTGIVCFPIFLGVYFGIFYPIFSLKVEKVENCQVIGVAPMNQAGYEAYVILYVDFQYEGQNFLGYACASDKYDDPNMYQILNYGDLILCDDVGSSYELNYKRIVNSQQRQLNQNQRVRMLSRVRGKCQSTGESLSSEYNFSKVKLSSWMCVDRNISYHDLVKAKQCFITFYKDKDQAYKNSKERVNLKDIHHFALTQFEVPSYFPKAGYICLIIFTYIPFLLNFYPASILVTKIVQKLIQKYKRLIKTNKFKFYSFHSKND